MLREERQASVAGELQQHGYGEVTTQLKQTHAIHCLIEDLPPVSIRSHAKDVKWAEFSLVRATFLANLTNHCAAERIEAYHIRICGQCAVCYPRWRLSPAGLQNFGARPIVIAQPLC
jgi:hypothetical protein